MAHVCREKGKQEEAYAMATETASHGIQVDDVLCKVLWHAFLMHTVYKCIQCNAITECTSASIRAKFLLLAQFS